MFDGGWIEVDIETIRQNVREAEVVTFYFPLLGKTLLVDTRTLTGEAVAGSMPEPVADAARRPLVRIVAMAHSADERFASLRRLRPEFDRPDSITMIPWGRRVDALQAEGVWALLLDRLEQATRAADEAAPPGATPLPPQAARPAGGPGGGPIPGADEAMLEAARQAARCAPAALHAQRLFDRLRQMETQLVCDALTGVGHRTLWGRGGAGDEG